MYDRYWVYFPRSKRISRVSVDTIDLLAARFPEHIYFEASRREVGK